MRIHDVSKVFYDYMLWVRQQAKEKKIKKIYFLTREGEFFKKIYDMLYLSEDSDEPQTELLEVSRVSTFFPSMSEISITQLMRIWKIYSTHSFHKLFVTLNVDENEYIDVLQKYNLSLDEMIVEPWTDQRVIRLFGDEYFLEQLNSQRIVRREYLHGYLKQKGWEHEKHIAIVDIGWKGTIQDNLCYMYPDYCIEGFYLGLHQIIKEQPDNAKKYGFLDGFAKKNSVFFTAVVLEMLCNSASGSTVGYQLTEKGYNAIKKNDVKEDRVYYNYTQMFQNSILKEIGKLRGNKLQITWRKDWKTIYHIIAYPDKMVMQAYFSLRHNDEFGAGEYRERHIYSESFLWLKAIFSKESRARFVLALRESAWPQGYLMVNKWYGVLVGYNVAVDWYLKRKWK